jgi:hypothetical protein
MRRDYLRDFRELIAELRRHPAVEVMAEHVPTREDGLAEFSVEDLRTAHGFSVPAEYADYIDVSLQTHLRFVYYVDRRVAGGGEFRLAPLYDALISRQDPELWNEDMPPDERDFLKRLRIFDDHPDAGDFKMGAFHLEPGVSPPAIPPIYFYDGGDYTRMSVDYGGYLDGLLGLFGVSNWQYLFCAPSQMSAEGRSEIYGGLRTTLQHFTRLFPHRDFARYRAMLP